MTLDTGTEQTATGTEALPWPPERTPNGTANGHRPAAGSIQGIRGRIALGAKRAADLIGALLVIVLFLPLWLVIAALIKLDSPGPVFFRQARVGRNGETFAMWKFRTMIPDADAYKLKLLHLNEAGDGLFKLREDPRVTRFGRFLRSTSLDEIPQLLHVLTGRMSLVGPRPLVPAEDAKITGGGRDRLRMRPGMTGPWQVAGASAVPIWRLVILDAEYVRDWTPLGDLKLIAQTIPHIVGRRGL